ncbi:MAG TPA: hypothetical protein VE860_18235, partial [Chthoniobacterales bacterium]|nr:hypothetical protein [Chthoniobacterales bacterium]
YSFQVTTPTVSLLATRPRFLADLFFDWLANGRQGTDFGELSRVAPAAPCKGVPYFLKGAAPGRARLLPRRM